MFVNIFDPLVIRIERNWSRPVVSSIDHYSWFFMLSNHLLRHTSSRKNETRKFIEVCYCRMFVWILKFFNNGNFSAQIERIFLHTCGYVLWIWDGISVFVLPECTQTLLSENCWTKRFPFHINHLDEGSFGGFEITLKWKIEKLLDVNIFHIHYFVCYVTRLEKKYMRDVFSHLLIAFTAKHHKVCYHKQKTTKTVEILEWSFKNVSHDCGWTSRNFSHKTYLWSSLCVSLS